MDKLHWSGHVTGVQPRIRLNRSFDEIAHSYLGYCLFIDGTFEGEGRSFSVGIGKAAQAKFGFQVGDEVSGQCLPVEDPRLEPVEFYRASKLKLVSRPEYTALTPPPWHGETPDLEIYRARGHRRLATKTFNKRCQSCIWGCRMPVVITVDHWQPQIRKFRFETFCYGPKSCRFYRAGPTRRVPGRRGMVYEEPDWLDEEATAHRGPDE
jgi:hypothetical protein